MLFGNKMETAARLAFAEIQAPKIKVAVLAINESARYKISSNSGKSISCWLQKKNDEC
jgi:hypothetical protein